MRTTIRWSTVLLPACLLAAAPREGHSGPAPAPASTSLPSGTRSYHPRTTFLITLDLQAAPPANDPDNYQCKFTYATASGSQTDDWDFISAHQHGTNKTVTLKFLARRTKKPKNLLVIKDTGAPGSGTIVISFPTTTIPATDPIPVEDPGVDPCDGM